MPIQIDKILSYSGNKYEKTCAMIKYSRYLAQKNDENLEVPVTRHTKDKITTIAINDILNSKISYHMEHLPEEK
jgi:DNA-directed RNA polymerase subunit K/omega